MAKNFENLEGLRDWLKNPAAVKKEKENSGGYFARAFSVFVEEWPANGRAQAALVIRLRGLGGYEKASGGFLTPPLGKIVKLMQTPKVDLPVLVYGGLVKLAADAYVSELVEAGCEAYAILEEEE